nr:Gag-Pol polyprotein [Tanacetum cinerariifolium]
MGYGNYQMGNVIISWVYYVKGLGHNLFSVGQFCDVDLEVTFRKNTCFIWNLGGVDLLSGSKDTNLYTIALDNMLKTSPIYLLSKASNTKSWLWHRWLSHLNFVYENVIILHQTSVARTPQQNGVVKRQNQTLVEAARTRLIFLKAHLFLWAEAINTTCYIQNRSLIRLLYNKTTYELMHDKKPDLSFLYVFGSLCYSTNDSRDLGKLNAKADIGLVPNLIPQQPYNPPNKYDWAHLFQPMFDEYFNPPTIAVSPVLVDAEPRAVDIVESFVSTSIDLDVPSIRSSSNVRPTHTSFKHPSRWTKDHPIANVIGDPSCSVSTRKQLEIDAMWCYFDAFVTYVETKNFKQAMTEPSWIDAIQEEIPEFERLQVWELVPCLVKVMNRGHPYLHSKCNQQEYDDLPNGRKNDFLKWRAQRRGCQDTRRSTSGIAQFLGDKLVGWSSRKQKSTTISSTKAGYIALSGCCAQILSMRQQKCNCSMLQQHSTLKSKVHPCTLPFYKGAGGELNSGTLVCSDEISTGWHLHQTLASRMIQLPDRKARNEKRVSRNA